MRIVNRPLGFLLGVAIIAAAVLLIIEVIGHALNGGYVLINWPAWQRWAERTQWNDAVIKVWSIVLIVVGLLLLFVELKPSRVSRLAVRSDDPATDAAITRPGLIGALQSAASDVDGVGKAEVKVTSRQARVRVTSTARESAVAQQLSEPVTNAVQDRLDGLGLASPPRLAVRVTSRSR